MVGPKQAIHVTRVINNSDTLNGLWVDFCLPELSHSILADPMSGLQPSLPPAADWVGQVINISRKDTLIGSRHGGDSQQAVGV